MEFELFRSIVVILPATLLVHQFVHRQHPVKRWVGGLFAHIWQFQWRLILLGSGIQLGLWEFTNNELLLHGVPVDAILGCGLLLGFLPRILFPHFPIVALIVLDSLILLFIFPLDFGSTNTTLVSLISIFLVSLIVIVPSHLLARWTEYDKHLYLRSTLQNISWAILLLWLFPSVLFNLTNDSWQPFLERHWYTNLLYLLPLVFPGIILLNALYEFAKHGRGTGFPYDSPKFLVTTGVYRFISNPMQLGIVLMMILWGAILESHLVMLSAAVAFILFLVFKNVCNGSCQLLATDPHWKTYQDTMPKWIPLKIKSRK